MKIVYIMSLNLIVINLNEEKQKACYIDCFKNNIKGMTNTWKRII